MKNLSKTVTIALVGKYVELPDAYISVVESLRHAGYAFDADIQVKWINAEEVTEDNVADLVQNADGILVPGGFGDRGVEGKITTVKYAREQRFRSSAFASECRWHRLNTRETCSALKERTQPKSIRLHRIRLSTFSLNKGH